MPSCRKSVRLPIRTLRARRSKCSFGWPTQRLALSPVPYQGWVLRRAEDGAVLACGQTAIEADLVGLYDLFTRSDARGQGLARKLCTTLLAQARAAGARTAYLQVEADNPPARAIYHRLGFADAYAYHYHTPEPGAF